MQEDYSAFESRDTVVIAIAQEDTNLKKHGLILKKFETAPPFDLVADLERKNTPRYRRTTAYLIDKAGVVREIFPMLIHHRATWQPILNEIDALNADSEAP